ncbi:MAG: T9SS type A sorting domain-containing protein [Candidatus Cloacimonetes bacterium]|nr:T9SS type A sorting domain-containing protein [Candidatus Cloacimonadota bacterium]MDY0172555.1 T9SS type A sorting domain-containing protein [Candidatus Cloacimonadaceae bacterium]
MRKALYLLPLLLLPMLLAAGVFQDLGFKHLGTVLPFSMAYRLQNETYSHYQEDHSLLPTERTNIHYSQTYPTRIDSVTFNHSDPYGFISPDTGAKLVYFYNAAGMIEATDLYFTPDSVLELSIKSTAEYDSQNRLVRIFLYGAFYDDLGNLEPLLRRHIVYGAGSTFEIYDWVADADEYEDEDPYSRISFLFDAQGRIIQEYEYSSADSVNWVQKTKTETTYHPQDTSTGYDYISFISQYLPSMFLNRSDEYPGKVQQTTEYEWYNEAWAARSRSLYTYDEQIRKISIDEQQPSGDVWEIDGRDLFYYDSSGNLDFIVMQIRQGGSSCTNTMRIDFAWETYTANSDLLQGPIPDLRIKAYPVPFAGELNIIAESKSSAPLKIGIYNQRGQLLNELSGLPDSNLAWDGRDKSGKACSSGIYFLRATQGSSTATAKIVKLQ